MASSTLSTVAEKGSVRFQRARKQEKGHGFSYMLLPRDTRVRVKKSPGSLVFS